MKWILKYFNSHPHEEDDNYIYLLTSALNHFNSHPHEEDDIVSVKKLITSSTISTHILTKRMTTRISTTSTVCIFQLTSSRRGWLYHYSCILFIRYFNSHPHEEDDNQSTSFVVFRLHFNSHPHEEDDNSASSMLSSTSIFQLTSSRRGWLFCLHFIGLMIISTHILTKRMTTFSVDETVILLFQLTSSRRGWLFWLYILLQYILFQLTSSRRGWLFLLLLGD